MKANKINIQQLTLENFSVKKMNQDKLDSYGFITENSKDFTVKLLDHAKYNINRPKIIYDLSKLVQNIEIASEIEKGIFEFSLTEITKNNLSHQGIVALYNDKVRDIILNLDINSHLNNKTLMYDILSNAIKPFTLAYLSPQQLHPEKWRSILNKRKFREDKENNMAFSDLYKCRKCGKSKCRVTELQTRCADEGTTKFITCLECFNSFTR